MARITHPGPIHLGLDVHRDTISVATLLPDAATAAVEQIASDEAAVLAFVGRFAEPGRLRVCYEAGPTGYELARLLHRQGVACQVIAPSLTPRAVGDKVKTDRRDCRRLARLHRAGELVAIRIPTAREEAVRDLCRARADLVDDRSRARRRLQSFLLRHGRVYRAGACWTGKHERWLGAQRFDDPQLRATYTHYRAVAGTRDAEVAAIEADLAVAATKPPFADAVARLGAYRGVGQLGALSLAAEVGDWRRFAHAAAFMAFTGLVPCERSSGDSVWRGHITRTGSKHLRFQLVESAWSYHHRPLIAGALRERQQRVSPETLARSWAAQLRLCRRFRQLERRKHIKGVVVVAVARELAGSCGPRCTPEPMPPVVGGSLIGASAPAAARARRSTADAGTIPEISVPRRARHDATRVGQLPAHSRLAVPIREHQSGGPPIHAAPTRSWPSSARPPPARMTRPDPTPGAAHRRLST
jgi:transposase